VIVNFLKGNLANVSVSSMQGFIPLFNRSKQFNLKHCPNNPVNVKKFVQNIPSPAVNPAPLEEKKAFECFSQIMKETVGSYSQDDSMSVISEAQTFVSSSSTDSGHSTISTVSSTSTLWRRPGLYRAKQNVAVPDAENHIRRGQFVHVVKFDRDHAYICEPFEGRVLFNERNFGIATKTFTAGQHQVGWYDVDVLDCNRDDAQYVDTLPKWSYVNLVRVEGACALINYPVNGWISVVSLKERTMKPTLFITEVPRTITQKRLVEILFEENAFHKKVDPTKVHCHIVRNQIKQLKDGRKIVPSNCAIVELDSTRRADNLILDGLRDKKTGAVMSVSYSQKYIDINKINL